MSTKNTETTAPRIGDWQTTFTGRQVWPLDPRVEDLCAEDIAHSLALQCRWAGHCREHYSVAEHSIRVSQFCEAEAVKVSDLGVGVVRNEYVREIALAALLHDASEAYLIDVPRPLKRHLAGYAEAEARFMRVVEQWSGLPPMALDWSMVKWGDEVLLYTEKRDLVTEGAPWDPTPNAPTPLAHAIVPRAWRDNEAEFLARLRLLRA